MATLYWVGGSSSQSWATGANWSTGSAPVTGDTVYFLSGTSDVTSGLAQSAVTLAQLVMGSGFTGTIGVAGDSGAYLDIGITSLLCISASSGNGFLSGGFARFKWNPAAVTFTANVQTTGSSADSGRSSLQIKGGTSSSKLYVTGGTVDLAAKPSETATLSLLEIGGNGVVVCGSGLTCPTIAQESSDSTLTTYGSVTTLTQNAGTLTALGTGAITTLYVNGNANLGNRPASADAVGTLTVDSKGVVNASIDPRVLLFTNPPTLLDGSRLIAFNKDQLKLTGPANFAFDLSNCGFGDVTLDIGQGFTATIS